MLWGGGLVLTKNPGEEGVRGGDNKKNTHWQNAKGGSRLPWSSWLRHYFCSQEISISSQNWTCTVLVFQHLDLLSSNFTNGLNLWVDNSSPPPQSLPSCLLLVNSLFVTLSNFAHELSTWFFLNSNGLFDPSYLVRSWKLNNLTVYLFLFLFTYSFNVKQ